MGNGNGIDWDPRHSSMATGAGMPWSAGNTTKPEAYWTAGLMDPMATVSGIAHDKFVAPLLSQWYGKDVPADPTQMFLRGQGLNLDTNGQERVNRENDARAAQNTANQQAFAANQLAARQLAESNQATTNRLLSEQATNQANQNSEDAFLQARNAARRARGNQIFGAYNG